MKFLKKHLTKAELISMIQTFIGFLAVDAAIQFSTVMSGDFSREAFLALLTAVGRSAVKAIWNEVVKNMKS